MRSSVRHGAAAPTAGPGVCCDICLPPAAGSADGRPREPVRLGCLLPTDAGPDELFGLVIPGYTLQCLDSLTDAVPHSGR